MILRLSLDLPSDREYVRTTRLLSRTLLEDLQVLSEDTDAIEVVVGELCSNVVRHATASESQPASASSGEPIPPSYQVVIEYHREKVVITVEDKGPGFDPKDLPEPGTARPDTLVEAGNSSDSGNGAAVAQRVGGFGIPIVAALSDYLDFEPADPTGTTVRAEKKLRYQSTKAEERATKMDESNHGAGASIEIATE